MDVVYNYIGHFSTKPLSSSVCKLQLTFMFLVKNKNT